MECRTLNQHNTTLAARTKKTSKGKTKERGGGEGREGRGRGERRGERKRGKRREETRGREEAREREREREGMCRCTHILIEERRERGWLSMRGVVAPPPPSNDQAELLLG